ncbi:hypothetical protein EJB05_41998, partial [Eragrostis curvula]
MADSRPPAGSILWLRPGSFPAPASYQQTCPTPQAFNTVYPYGRPSGYVPYASPSSHDAPVYSPSPPGFVPPSYGVPAYGAPPSIGTYYHHHQHHIPSTVGSWDQHSLASAFSTVSCTLPPTLTECRARVRAEEDLRLAEEIAALLPLLDDMTVSHVRRAGNRVADGFAKLGHGVARPRVWRDAPPEELLRQLQRDAEGK